MSDEPPKRILLADDDAGIRQLIGMVLKNGYLLTLCPDAETALVRLGSEAPFDLIICDFMMPGISGIDFVEKVRAKRGAAKTPVLMISGHTNYAMEARARSVGADAFLKKPFTVAQLRSTVKALTERPPIEQPISVT